MSSELVMPSNHLVLCRPLLLLPSVSSQSDTTEVTSQQQQLFTSGRQSIGASLYHIGINFLKTASEWLHVWLTFSLG